MINETIVAVFDTQPMRRLGGQRPAVVAKTARVKEKVVIHKDTAERVETVRDTARREEAEVTKEAGAERTADTTTTASPMSPKKPLV